MKFLIALISEITKYGRSIALSINYLPWKKIRFKKTFEKALASSFEEDTAQTANIIGLGYAQVLAYAKEEGEIVEENDGRVRFIADLDDRCYDVSLRRESTSTWPAILTCRDATWIGDFQDWLKAHGYEASGMSRAEICRMTELRCNIETEWGDEDFTKEVSCIPRQICKLQSLELLNFSTNEVRTVAAGIGSLSNLAYLYLQYNKISSLPAEIGELRNLKVLNLTRNQLVDLPPEIGNLKKLTNLVLSSNALTTLPREIGLLNLHLLYADNNNLETLPADIGKLSYGLLSLHFQNNKLKSLPIEIGDIGGTSVLYLHNNSLAEVPGSLSKPKNICCLTLNGNPLNKLPPEIVDLKVKELLSFGHMPHLALSANQVKWLRALESGGCIVWLQCPDLTLGEATLWEKYIEKNDFDTWAYRVELDGKDPSEEPRF